MIKLKEAKQKDVKLVVDLWKEFMKDHDKLLLSLDKKLKEQIEKKKDAEKIFEEYLNKCMKSKDSRIVLAFYDSKIAGFLSLNIKGNIPIQKLEKIGYISDLFVKKEFRGKGISSALKDDAIRWFKKKKIKYASIRVYALNDYAHSIYNKWGFDDFHIELRKKI